MSDGKSGKARAFDTIVDPVRNNAGAVVTAVLATVVGGLILARMTKA